MGEALDALGRVVAVLAAFLVLPLLVGQTEHKVMAHMQGRLGPMYAGGYHGWAQLVADGVKFAQKEDVVPADADRRVFQLAPAVALLPYLLVLIAVPIGPGEGAVGVEFVLPAGRLVLAAVVGGAVAGEVAGAGRAGGIRAVVVEFAAAGHTSAAARGPAAPVAGAHPAVQFG